jgi:4a-hydroxytetrahydrobiopterin dehydratase
VSEYKDLYLRQCLASFAGQLPLDASQKQLLLKEIAPYWNLTQDNTILSCILPVDHFRRSFHLASLIAEMAEEQNHHPVLQIAFKYLKCEIWTQQIQDLVEADFIFAAKVDRIYQEFL